MDICILSTILAGFLMPFACSLWWMKQWALNHRSVIAFSRCRAWTTSLHLLRGPPVGDLDSLLLPMTYWWRNLEICILTSPPWWFWCVLVCRTTAVIWQTLPPTKGTEIHCWCGKLVQNQRNHVKGKNEVFQLPCVQSQYFSRWVRWMTKFKGIKETISSSERARSKQPLGWHPSHTFDYHFLTCNFLRFFAFSKTCEADSKTKWQTLLLLLTFFFVKLKGCFTKAGLIYLWTWATVLWCHWGKTQVIW